MATPKVLSRLLEDIDISVTTAVNRYGSHGVCASVRDDGNANVRLDDDDRQDGSQAGRAGRRWTATLENVAAVKGGRNGRVETGVVEGFYMRRPHAGGCAGACQPALTTAARSERWVKAPR